jgi:hypothetical protein
VTASNKHINTMNGSNVNPVVQGCTAVLDRMEGLDPARKMKGSVVKASAPADMPNDRFRLQAYASGGPCVLVGNPTQRYQML